MNEIQKFSFNETAVNVIDRDGTAWFIAKNICDVLGLTNVTESVRSLDNDEKYQLDMNIINSEVGGRGTIIISESGFYKLVFRSRKKVAKAFTKWVTSEVLPSIRKHGGYINPAANEETVKALVEKWTAERTAYLSTIVEQAAELALSRRDNEIMKRAISIVSPKYPFGSVSKSNGRRKTNFRCSAWFAPKSADQIKSEIVQLLLPLFQ